jgi:hypothetical protein
MPRIGQILTRLFVSLVLLGGFVLAPFQHEHHDQAGEHDLVLWGGHAHLHAAHEEAEIEAADLHGQPQDWVAGTVERSGSWVAEAAPERTEIHLPLCPLRQARVLRPGHDPPPLTHLIPRAPPA